MDTAPPHLFLAPFSDYCVGAKIQELHFSAPLSKGLYELDAFTQDLEGGREVAVTFPPALVACRHGFYVETPLPFPG